MYIFIYHIHIERDKALGKCLSVKPYQEDAYWKTSLRKMNEEIVNSGISMIKGTERGTKV